MSKFENISFDHCLKCTVCTAYCPVARATHIYPGPKTSGPDAERLRIKNPQLVDESIKYCLNCKRCEVVCPSDVHCADIINIARNKYIKQRMLTIKNLRNFVMAHTDLLGFAGTRFTWLVNFSMKMPLVRYFMELIMKIPHQRVFPTYQKETLFAWYKREQAAHQETFSRKVLYFRGCAANYQEHELGKNLIRVMNAMGIGVLTTKEICCGVPLIANGYLDSARFHGRYNISRLSQALREKNMTIISASSSCTYALKHEYHDFLGLDNSPIYHNIQYITKFLYEEFEKGNIPALKPVALKIAYHAPCHLERMGASIYTVDLLKRIPGLDAHFMHSECCGISGTYGFKTENYEISQTIGEELFKRIRKIDPDYVVTDCETCKWQIEMSTQYKVLHPLTVLAMALNKEV